MNLLIHDLAAAIEREASDGEPSTDEYELSSNVITVEAVLRLERGEERMRRQLRGVTR